MLGKDNAFEIMEKAIAASEADQTQLVLLGKNYSLTRFANSQIHQNAAVVNSTLFIKTIKNKKIGVTSVNHFDESSLKDAVKRATDASTHLKETPGVCRLPDVCKYEKVNTYYPRTAKINAEEKALIIQDMIGKASPENLTLAGGFFTGTLELAVVNSNGLKAYTSETRADINIVTTGIDTTGYASAASRDVDAIDYNLLIEEAVESAKSYGSIIDVEPGEYTVLLDEYAVAEMLLYLSLSSFSSEAVEEGHSFITQFKGQKIFSDNVNIYDDAYASGTFQMPFDYEGVPKKRVDFIKKGVVTGNVTHNTFTGDKHLEESSGHAVLPISGHSASIPMHVFMGPGDKKPDEMKESIKKGLLIKRFHYLTLIHPLKTILSGMTRDGVFLVENGVIKSRVHDLRFTQSIIDVLKNIRAMSEKRKQVWFRDFRIDFPLSITVPKLLVDNFNFTGKTSF